MALLPPEKVGDAFVEIIMEEAPIEKYPQLTKFLDYFTINWVDDDAKFQINLWNHFHNENQRTNNNNEAYNLRLDKRSEKHPNIWKFIELLQKEELHTSVKFERIEDGTLKIRGRKRVDLLRDLSITTSKNVYLQIDCTFDDFINLYMINKQNRLNVVSQNSQNSANISEKEFLICM